MFGLTRWNPVDDMAFQREFDRLFNQIWGGAPARAAAPSGSFHVRTMEDGWQVSIPIPGIDPKQVAIDVSGQTLTVHAEPDRAEGPYTRFDQAITVPTVVDLERVKASYRHGVLELTLPYKETVKPRRIAIDVNTADRKQLDTVVS